MPDPKKVPNPKILVINGPNLNLIGILRDQEMYGALTLQEINAGLEKIALAEEYQLETFQSNCEGEIVTRIQKAYSDGTVGILINAAGYTHTSVAILDALTLRGSKNPFPYVEIHLSSPETREMFRRFSYLRMTAVARVSGKQAESYYEGFRLLIRHLERMPNLPS